MTRLETLQDLCARLSTCRHKRPKVIAAIKLASDATGVPPEAIMSNGHRGSRKIAAARRIAVLNLYEGKGQDVLYNQSEVARCLGMNHTSVRDIVNAFGSQVRDM